MHKILTTLVAGALVLGLARTADAQILRLRTGKFLIGSVETANEDGIRFKRLDTGGLLRLDWRDVNAGDAVALRKRFHLVSDAEAADVMIDAMKVTFAKGGARREYVGELISRDGNNFEIRRRGVTVRVPVSDMRATPEVVRVPIRDILTADEIYQRKLTETEPGEDAKKHLQLGVYLIRVADYPRAKQHLEKAQELGGGEQPKEIDRQLARVASLIKHKAEADMIAEINVLRNRKRFTKALALCEQFEQKYPNSKLKNEYERRKQSLMKDRETWLVRQVTSDWYQVLRDEAGKIARSGVSFEEAKSKAEEELPQEIRKRIARVRGIPEPDVQRFFKMRHERRVSKIKLATYSLGSWILGDKEVIKGTAADTAKKNDPKKKEASRQDKIRKELEKRMKDWLRKANRARGKSGGEAQELETEDQWWKGATSTTRTLWLMAHYAEKSGDMQVVSASVTKCPTCGARGTLLVTGSVGGQSQNVPCHTCHKTRWIRGIRFR